MSGGWLPPGRSGLLRHLLRPAGPGAVYLWAHAVRSKWTPRQGAVEVAGAYHVWRQQGLSTRSR